MTNTLTKLAALINDRDAARIEVLRTEAALSKFVSDNQQKLTQLLGELGITAFTAVQPEPQPETAAGGEPVNGSGFQPLLNYPDQRKPPGPHSRTDLGRGRKGLKNRPARSTERRGSKEEAEFWFRAADYASSAARLEVGVVERFRRDSGATANGVWLTVDEWELVKVEAAEHRAARQRNNPSK